MKKEKEKKKEKKDFKKEPRKYWILYKKDLQQYHYR
jgi:hypothetical protein